MHVLKECGNYSGFAVPYFVEGDCFYFRPLDPFVEEIVLKMLDIVKQFLKTSNNLDFTPLPHVVKEMH